ncbi:HTH-type transcriptional regulator NsrR [Candidatus Filomicrobium marinum]|uniref:HTH-type transcriptional regulator NsrR n=2 Tax=Filomicrobium TaxID=119044 RepID=A0A0D6JF88_9HYPH|nr:MULTISPECIES: Rrf2 family transcriptional regulator [Filomicrobium]MCV0370142.1 Rrf2 family transcriptional regulator [Filomicrobium sp.]CFX25630.1 HTH-type transcriptional regulator NsrR [Candidatus Filomicrobium marinum]CPR19326.1 HTH-type transcriptional regulator NsrR [Candidatus Filomicrobium marinum]SDO08808.1 transcriptional regulator, BadM/Rrf2 family [Filomicrobium insigne]
MRLTVMSDYSLRVLMYLGAKPEHRATIQEIASAYGISENHLMKVVHGLGRQGFVETVRGRGGGLRLARPADKIKIGDVIKAVEDDFALVECFRDENVCRISNVCRLRGVLRLALEAYFRVLDDWTVADLVTTPTNLFALLSDLPSSSEPATRR